MADDRIAELFETLGRIDERTQRTADDVEALKHVVLEGNGSPSLVKQVADNTARIASVEESRKGKWALIVAVVSGLFAVAVVVIEKLSA